jgi:hypothetical protein
MTRRKPNPVHRFGDVRVSEAQMEALSILAARERGEAGPKSLGQIDQRTIGVLLRSGLVEWTAGPRGVMADGSRLVPSERARAILPEFPDWEWRA